MDKYEFLWLTLLWDVVEYIWYHVFLYYPVLWNEKDIGKPLLIGMMIGFYFLNIIASNLRNRTLLSGLSIGAIPIGFYSVLAYGQILPKKWLIIAMICLIPGLLYQFPLYCRPIPPGREKAQVLRSRRIHGFISIRRCLGVSSVLLTIGVILFNLDPMNAHYFSHTNTLSSKVAQKILSENFTYGEEYSFESQIDNMLLLKEENWENLDAHQRLAVLQCVVNYEAYILGVDHRIYLNFGELNSTTLGYYHRSSGSIVINYDHMMDSTSEVAVNTICHEVFHAAQHTYANLYKRLPEEYKQIYFLNDAAIYVEEFANYIDGEEDFNSYHAQKVETDARSYSKEATEKIFHLLSQHQ